MSTVSLGYKIIEVAHLLYLPNYIAPYVHSMYHVWTHYRPQWAVSTLYVHTRGLSVSLNQYEHTTALSEQFEPYDHTTGLSQQFEPCVNTLQASVRA